MKAKNIHFTYSQAHGLFNGLNVEIPRGKITTIIGPNGCGKSTLLGLLTKAYAPQKGEVYLGDRCVQHIKQKEFAQHVSVLHQHNEEKVHMTVRELVSQGRMPYQNLWKEKDEKAEEVIQWALECTQLIDIQDKEVDALSGGQRQRVWLAMALCQQPDVLFLDEPTSYLDMYYQIQLLELVQMLNTRYQMTIVMVLHDLNQAINFSNHIIVMHQGKVVQIGEPKQVINEKLIEEVYQIQGKLHEAGDKIYLLPY